MPTIVVVPLPTAVTLTLFNSISVLDPISGITILFAVTDSIFVASFSFSLPGKNFIPLMVNVTEIFVGLSTPVKLTLCLLELMDTSSTAQPSHPLIGSLESSCPLSFSKFLNPSASIESSFFKVSSLSFTVILS